MASQVLDVLIEGTVVGTTYRKLLCYDLPSIASLRSLKARVLGDLKAAGAPIESDCEVVLRNYHICDYDAVASSSDVARSCALGEQDPLWPVGKSGCARLVTAAPCPRLPLDTSDQGRQAVLAIASRQFYDRARGDSAVLPLEARVKPSAPSAQQPPESDDATISAPSSPVRVAAAAPQTIDPTPFDITVRDFRGRCHSVRVCGATSVQRLKEGIAMALGCSVFSHWRLLHSGRPLVESLDLDDYNIAAGNVIDVQMTSKRGDLLPGGHNNVPGGSKDVLTGGRRQGPEGGAAGANSTGSGNHAGQAGGGSVGGQPSCPGEKAPGSQVVVQVLLPCGRLLLVARGLSQHASHFLNGVLGAQKAMLEPEEAPSAGQEGVSQALLQRALGNYAAATEAAAAAAPPAADADLQAAAVAAAVPAAKVLAAEVKPASMTPRAGLEVSVVAARAAKVEVMPAEAMAAAMAVLSSGPGPRTRARRGGRRPAGELKDVIGQKLLAILLAAAAVMMAMVVL